MQITKNSIEAAAGPSQWFTGAAPGRCMTHLAMLEVDDDGNPAAWSDHVTDEEYNPASAVIAVGYRRRATSALRGRMLPSWSRDW